MNRFLCAALALACAGALLLLTASTSWLLNTGALLLLAVGLLGMAVAPHRVAIAIPAAVVVVWGSSAFAAEVREVGDTAVIVPWGDYLVATAQMAVQIMLPVILPIVAGYAIQAIRRVYPWAALFLTQARLEQMAVALSEYGLNAVSGAAKGKTLSVSVGSSVVAAGLNRALETVPQAVIDKAGGPEGVAKLIFRKLNLEEAASEATVLIPALNKLGVPR